MLYTQEENLIIQSFMMVNLLVELKKNNFTGSDFFDNMDFDIPEFKTFFKESNIDNQGAALATLYLLLTVPKELIFDRFQSDFNSINNEIDSIKLSATSNYSSDASGINYIRHIRNAVAHAAIKFVPNISVTFSDESNYRGIHEECSITIPLQDLYKLLESLQGIIIKYINEIQSRNPETSIS